MTEKFPYSQPQQIAEQLRHLSLILDRSIVDAVRSASEAHLPTPELPPLNPATVYIVDTARLVAGISNALETGQRIFAYPLATESSPLEYWQTLALQAGLPADLARNTDPRRFVADYFANLRLSGEQVLICITEFDSKGPAVLQEMIRSAVELRVPVMVLSEQHEITLPKPPRFSLRKSPAAKLEYLNTSEK